MIVAAGSFAPGSPERERLAALRRTYLQYPVPEISELTEAMELR
jgi:hypothetical protein